MQSTFAPSQKIMDAAAKLVPTVVWLAGTEFTVASESNPEDVYIVVLSHDGDTCTCKAGSTFEYFRKGDPTPRIKHPLMHCKHRVAARAVAKRIIAELDYAVS